MDDAGTQAVRVRRLVEWMRLAKVGPNVSDNSTYARGFLDAAHTLVDTTRQQDLLIYPVLFLYRHAAELAIKGLVANCHLLDEYANRYHDVPRSLGALDEATINNTHSLDKLWAEARRCLHAIRHPESEITDAGACIDSLHKDDPTGQKYRYEAVRFDRKLVPSFPEFKTIDLAEVKLLTGVRVERLVNMNTKLWVAAFDMWELGEAVANEELI